MSEAEIRYGGLDANGTFHIWIDPEQAVAIADLLLKNAKEAAANYPDLDPKFLSGLEMGVGICADVIRAIGEACARDATASSLGTQEDGATE